MKRTCFLLMLLGLAQPLFPEEKTITINMAYVVDHNLPTISAKGIREIVASARDEFEKKFGTNDFKFNYLGERPVNQFFRNNLRTQDPYYKELNSKKLKFFSKKIDYEPHQDAIIAFLKQWKLWDLAQFFPEQIREKINTYEDILPYLYAEYHSKVKILENLKQKNKKLLIDRKYNVHNSYVNWKAAMHFQKEYDIVICNTLIVYDDYTQPYPHAVLRYAKVGGSSFLSPLRAAFDGTSAMVNLFEVLTDIPYFKARNKARKIPENIWNDLVGRYIMAHEMGHMIFLIPDVYNHPEGCLMDSSVQNLDYYDGYQILLKYPIRCVKCQPYVEARMHHFKGDKLFAGKDFENAAREYRLSKKMTPEDLDIDYKVYSALLDVKMARCYLKLNDREQAAYYLNDALKLDPENKDARTLLAGLKKTSR